MHRIILLLLAASSLALAQDFGDLEQRADEVAIVTVNSSTLQALLRACSDNDDDTREALRVLAGVTEINVRSLSFHEGKMPSDDEIGRLRTRLVPAGWPKFLSSRSKEPNETVEGYWGPAGMALLTWEPGEITYVQIKGFISPKDVPALGHRFGIPEMRQGLVIQAPAGLKQTASAGMPVSDARPARCFNSRLVRSSKSCCRSRK